MRGADSLQAAHKLAIGFGTVFLYCRRVIRALREIGLQVITWGDEDHHNETMTHVMNRSGIPHCVGMLDGTLIRLTEMPEINGLSFICCKKYPAINVQAVVDHEKHFIAIELGWPGSISDVTMWKKSHIWQRRTEYFAGNMLLLADKGYLLLPNILRPFTEPEVNGTSPLSMCLVC